MDASGFSLARFARISQLQKLFAFVV